jgi:hypothetical protein
LGLSVPYLKPSLLSPIFIPAHSCLSSKKVRCAVREPKDPSTLTTNYMQLLRRLLSLLVSHPALSFYIFHHQVVIALACVGGVAPFSMLWFSICLCAYGVVAMMVRGVVSHPSRGAMR